MEIDLEKPATQATIGKILDLTRQAVGDIEAAGVCARGMSLRVWLATYAAHLREIAAGRVAGGSLELSEERSRLARAQAVRVEMQNAQTRRELAPVRTLEFALARLAARAVAHLDGIPGRLRRRMPHWKQHDFEALEAEIARARNLAADVKLEDEDLDGFERDTESEPVGA